MARRQRKPYRVPVEHRDPSYHPKACRDCGQPFLSRVRLGRPYFCSPACQRRDRDQRRKEQRDERREQRLAELAVRCAVCGEAVEAQRRTRKYCSDKCRLKAARTRGRS